jgi:hypothetical protein
VPTRALGTTAARRERRATEAEENGGKSCSFLVEPLIAHWGMAAFTNGADQTVAAPR